MILFKKQKSDIPRRRLDGKAEQKTVSSSHVFRRNRTLTGTTSLQMNSVNANSDLESPRKHTHKLAIIRRRIFEVLLFVVVVSASMWFLVTHLTATVVVSVSDSSISKPLDRPRYEKVIQEYLDANPLGRLSFLLDEKGLTKYVSVKLPEVSSVNQQGMVSIGGTGFVVRLRTPTAGWKISGKQFYVDSSGIPFEQNYFSSPVVQIIDNSGISVQSTSIAIASKRFLAFVGKVVYMARASGYTVTQAALPANTTRELELHFKEIGYYAKLSIDRPAGEQVEDMATAFRYFKNSGTAPQYVDVRVGGKAFYR